MFLLLWQTKKQQNILADVLLLSLCVYLFVYIVMLSLLLHVDVASHTAAQ